MDDLEQDIHVYLLDTNFFRYYSNAASPYQEKAALFWEKIKAEVSDDVALIGTSEEVVRELEVQFLELETDQVEEIQELLIDTTVFPYKFSIDAEYALQQLGSYVCKTYKNSLREVGLPIDLIGTSDSRIILTALENECLIVTANVKDFLVYILLSFDPLFSIYDPNGGKIVCIPNDLYNSIQKDANFQTLKLEVLNYIN